MKKILILMCVFLNGCCLDCGVITELPYEGLIYEMSDKSIVSEAYSPIATYYEANSIALITSYELPEKHSKDFLNTVILFFTKPELSEWMDIRFGYDNKSDIQLSKVFFDHYDAKVSENTNYDQSVTDQKNVNYYKTTLTIYIQWLGLINKAQIHLRQDLEPTTKISYMIMGQPFVGQPYEYIGHAVLDNLNVRPTYGTRQPLPDILK